ncbi:MAG: family oxidoreductase, partial [Aeromicrobium sp.]|uniref:FAD-dependent oxidoreductase n=1 Tax=Aeromicrobium sp. TaxID=1871063 RepID=UPI00261B225C
DVVVVGRGFGGAATALRLTEAGHRVIVLERAPSFLPVANQVTRAYAEASGGTPFNLIGETLGAGDRPGRCSSRPTWVG